MIKVFHVEKDDYSHAGNVSSQIKKELKSLGISTQLLRNIAIACYEAEINLIIHSYGGDITFELNDEGKVILKFDDVGPGIEDLTLALTPGWSTASKKAREFGFGAGMGLANMKRVSNCFEINSAPSGTHLRMEFFEE